MTVEEQIEYQIEYQSDLFKAWNDTRVRFADQQAKAIIDHYIDKSGTAEFLKVHNGNQYFIDRCLIKMGLASRRLVSLYAKQLELTAEVKVEPPSQ